MYLQGYNRRELLPLISNYSTTMTSEQTSPLSLFRSLGGAGRYKIRTAARNPTDSKLILIVDRLTSTHPLPSDTNEIRQKFHGNFSFDFNFNLVH